MEILIQGCAAGAGIAIGRGMMAMDGKSAFGAVAFTLAMCLMPTLLSAQAPASGQISGQILDTTKAAVPDATVVARNPATGETRTVKSDNFGHYVLTDLPPGTYDLSVEKTGFEKQIQTGLVVNVASSEALDFILRVGSVSQQVVVTSQAPVLEKTDASNGTVMSERQLMQLPINGRDYARFSLLTPGAAAGSNFIADLRFDGLHTVHNQFSIDGIDATRVDQPYMANGYERGSRLLTGSLDTIAEFKVQVADYSAQYGRAAGTYINIVTKSGTNDLHGSVFDYFRNDILDARNVFALQKPEFRYNDFGGNLGGPIKHNKVFYYLNYEGSRQRVGITGGGAVPSALLRSEVMAASPQLAPIVMLYPVGTSSTSNPLVDNYSTNKVSQVREDTASVRFDETLGTKDTAFERVNVNDSHVFGPLFGVTPSALGLLDFQNVPIRTTNIALSEQHVFGSGMINTILGGMQRWGSKLISDEPFPLTSVTGLTVVPGTRGRGRQVGTSIQVGDSMSLVKGRHTLQWGGTVYRITILRSSVQTTSMTFTSLQNFTNDSVATASVTVGDPGHVGEAEQIGLYAQDTFQVRPGVSVNYGLRYDLETVPHDSTYSTQTFDTRTNALAPVGGQYFQMNTTDFGPRVGIAWSPTSRIVVRSGYGIYFQAYPVGFCCYSVPLNNIPGNTTLLQQQIPNLSYPFDSFISQGTHPLPTVAGFAWNKPDIYANQWDFSVGTQLNASTALQVGYVGNHGVNLRRNMDINFFDPSLRSRPNPDFADINIETATGFSSYNGLQVQLQQRWARGFLYTVNYTLAHAIDDVQDQGLYSAQPQNNNNFKAERGNSSGDIRHNFTFDLLYNLPIGQGHRFLNPKGAGLQRLAGGWQVSALGLLHTGLADTVYIGTNTFGNGNFTNQRPNCVPGVDPYASPRTAQHWLNPAAFALPAPGTFGNCARNSVYGPPLKQFDFSLIKNTKIAERQSLDFQAEFFDIFNHPNFDEPNTVFTPSNLSSFGEIFNTLGRTIGFGTSRQIQLSLRLNF